MLMESNNNRYMSTGSSKLRTFINRFVFQTSRFHWAARMCSTVTGFPVTYNMLEMLPLSSIVMAWSLLNFQVPMG